MIGVSDGGMGGRNFKALVLGLVLIAGTAIEQAPSVGPLMSHVTKLVLRVLMNRLRARSLMEISQWFHADRGTRNAIFVLRRLVERSIQKQKDVLTCFIDSSKAFDTVKHALLFDLLLSLYIESHDIKLLANLYRN